MAWSGKSRYQLVRPAGILPSAAPPRATLLTTSRYRRFPSIDGMIKAMGISTSRAVYLCLMEPGRFETPTAKCGPYPVFIPWSPFQL